MNIDVALLPGEARRWGPSVCIVVDQLRASSTIVSALDGGCTGLWLASSLREARRLARQHGSVLAGEREGVRPPGFDVNNSPAELARLQLPGRSLVLSTTNGTAVIRRLARMPEVLVGSLANARAAAVAAIGDARARGIAVGVVCAGRVGGFAVDDAFAAGVLVERLIEAAGDSGRQPTLSESAQAARAIAAAYSEPLRAFEGSASAVLMRRLGAEADLELCSRIDISRTVPVVIPGPPLRIERHTSVLAQDPVSSGRQARSAGAGLG